MMLLVGCLLASVVPQAAEADEQFNAAVVYTDAKADTVFNIWEYVARQPVRRLCYIDNDDRPEIAYADISAITFGRSDRDGRKISIEILLHDGRTKQGLLWFNDSFFGTTKDGAEWRGRIANLSSLTFIPGTATSEAPDARPGDSRSGSGRP